MTLPNCTCSVLIAGAGPTAAYLAHQLALARVDVALIHDPRTKPKPWLETTSTGAKRFLHQLGVRAHSESSGRSSIWGTDEPIERPAILNPARDLLVDRSELDAACRNAAVRAGARVHTTRVESLERQHDGTWEIALGDGTRVCAGWAVDATGRAAKISRLLGASRLRRDRLVAIAYELKQPMRAAKQATLVASAEDGWWYVGPRSMGACAIYFTDADLRGRSRSDLPKWCGSLGETLGGFSASTELTWPCGEAGWLAVGDAALCADPLSGQGLHFGFEMAELAARTILGDCHVSAYNEQLRDQFVRFLARQAIVYQMERRWPDRAFWRRRTLEHSSVSLRSHQNREDPNGNY